MKGNWGVTPSDGSADGFENGGSSGFGDSNGFGGSSELEETGGFDEGFNILIVDDERAYGEVLVMVLRTEGYQADLCTSPSDVIDILQSKHFDLVISDLIMPEMDGLALLKAVKTRWEDMYFIITTAYGTIENAVEAMRQGAFTYIIKGSEPEILLKEVGRVKRLKLAASDARSSQLRQAPAGANPCADTPEAAARVSQPPQAPDARSSQLPQAQAARSSQPRQAQAAPLTQAAQASDMLNGFLLTTANPEFRDILKTAEKAARSNANILILGESGSGKEVLADYIHNMSKRAKLRFLPVNCCTFAENLLESELFGYEKGAFTGAAADRKGRFEAVNGGTLFLDEICDIPLSIQAKLLRAIENKTITKIGSNDEFAVDFRLISATNKSPDEEISKGLFREDLFYRISAIILYTPPLRRRKEDIPALLNLFLERSRRSIGLSELRVDNRIIEALLDYRFPGNIRELKNIAERLVVLSDDGYVRFEDLEDHISGAAEEELDALFEKRYSLRELRAEVESKYIVNLLNANNNSMIKTAKSLGISTRHLLNKISEYGINAGGEAAPGLNVIEIKDNAAHNIHNADIHRRHGNE
ncbi:MAG: sigma 54-interacting transcriptional regulator [Clostridiales Family XIII bacterium]|jgi:DNA-binding NtrC family response regulator|nr:sigma 54-interacting transcriptional regulator [Clostridiales Family XIII bacterium]